MCPLRGHVGNTDSVEKNKNNYIFRKYNKIRLGDMDYRSHIVYIKLEYLQGQNWN